MMPDGFPITTEPLVGVGVRYDVILGDLLAQHPEIKSVLTRLSASNSAVGDLSALTVGEVAAAINVGREQLVMSLATALAMSRGDVGSVCGGRCESCERHRPSEGSGVSSCA